MAQEYWTKDDDDFQEEFRLGKLEELKALDMPDNVRAFMEKAYQPGSKWLEVLKNNLIARRKARTLGE